MQQLQYSVDWITLLPDSLLAETLCNESIAIQY